MAKMPQNRRENSWKPGQSGNPKGRPPKGATVKEILLKLGEQKMRLKVGDQELEVSRREAYLMRAFQMAIGGDLAAMKFIASYSDGMPRQVQDIFLSTGIGEDVSEDEEQILARLMGDIFDDNGEEQG